MPELDIMDQIFISRFSSWAPPADDIYKSPDLSFCDPMFRRRLSQVSKMTIQVVHDLLPAKDNAKIFFASFRGEVSRQFSINKMVIEDKEVSPAAFSMSVFNAPPALATMAFSLKGGYCAVYPKDNSIFTALCAAGAALLSGADDELIFVYADEALPKEYISLAADCSSPLAFSILLKRKNENGLKPLSSFCENEKENLTPQDFLKRLTI